MRVPAQIVTQQHVLVPQVQPPARHHRRHPTGVPAPVRRVEPPGLRVARWRRLDQVAAPRATSAPGRLEVRYRPVEGVAEELAELAAAEQACCSFVTWSVTVEDGAPTLHVDAPEDRPDAVLPVVALFER